MYIFIHLCDALQYLLAVTYITMCNGFVLGLEIIHWASGRSTSPFISFPLGVKAFGFYWMAATLYSFIWLPAGLRHFVKFVYMYSVILGIQVL